MKRPEADREVPTDDQSRAQNQQGGEPRRLRLILGLASDDEEPEAVHWDIWSMF